MSLKTFRSLYYTSKNLVDLGGNERDKYFLDLGGGPSGDRRGKPHDSGKYAPCISRKVEPQVIVSRSAPGNSQERKGSGMGRVAIALGISLGIIILADI